jgi:hypothetical protein
MGEKRPSSSELEPMRQIGTMVHHRDRDLRGSRERLAIFGYAIGHPQQRRQDARLQEALTPEAGLYPGLSVCLTVFA